MVAENKKLFAWGIFKVIYAPQKAFSEIAQKPRYIGPILIMILFTAGNMASFSVTLSKIYVEQTIPVGTYEKRDEWTENATMWASTLLGMEIMNNDVDFINTTSGQILIPFYHLIITYYGYKSYYGNKSIQFSINHTATMWMSLENIGPIDCSEHGYNNISLRVKGLLPTEKPRSAKIYLLSTTGYSSYDFTSQLSFNGTVWDSVQIPLRTNEWQNGGNVNWSNINGLKLEFAWDTPQNITLLIDGLFFRGIFSSPIIYFPTSLFIFLIDAFRHFIINWVVLGGLIYIISKAFRGKTKWNTMLILIGFTLITFFIQAVIYVAAISTVPTLHYRLELLGRVEGESKNALDSLLNDMGLFLATYQISYIVMLIWTIVLCAVATRIANEFSWSKSLLIAVVGYYVSNIVMGFLPV